MKIIFFILLLELSSGKALPISAYRTVDECTDDGRELMKTSQLLKDFRNLGENHIIDYNCMAVYGR